MAYKVKRSSPFYVQDVRQTMNFPGNHPLHFGFDGGEPLEKADVILVIDSDVP
jgi:hypothetical protein